MASVATRAFHRTYAARSAHYNCCCISACESRSPRLSLTPTIHPTSLEPILLWRSSDRGSRSRAVPFGSRFDRLVVRDLSSLRVRERARPSISCRQASLHLTALNSGYWAWIYVSEAVVVLSVLLVVGTLSSLLAAAFADPGIVPRSSRIYPEDLSPHEHSRSAKSSPSVPANKNSDHGDATNATPEAAFVPDECSKPRPLQPDERPLLSGTLIVVDACSDGIQSSSRHLNLTHRTHSLDQMVRPVQRLPLRLPFDDTRVALVRSR